MQTLANWWFIHEGIYSREVVYRSLVETVLRDAKRPLTLREITNKLTSVFEQKDAFPEDCVTTGIEQSTHIIPSPDVPGAYTLTEEGVREMTDADHEFEQQRDVFYSHVFLNIEQKTGEPFEKPTKRKQLQEAIDEVLGGVFEKHNLELALGFLRGLDYSFPEEYLVNGLDKEILAAVERIYDEASQIKRLKTVQGIKEALKEVPPSALPYLVGIHRKFFMLKMIGFDPKLQRMRREAMTGRHLYLDTNVVLSALFSEHPQYEVTTKTLSKCQALGMNLYITTETANEVQSQFKIARIRWSRLSQNPTLLEVASNCGDDIIVTTFFKKYRRLGWNAYVEIFADLEAVLRLYGVSTNDVESDGLLELVSDPDNPVSNILRVYKVGKPDETIWHDAFHVYLVDRRRQELQPDEFGHRVWLLTLDGKLSKAQREFARVDNLKPPYAKLIPEWLSRISVYEGPDASGFSPADYVRLVLRARLGLVPKSPDVSTDFLAALAQSRLPIGELTALPIDVLRRVIIKLQMDVDVNRLVDESRESQDPETRHRIDEEFKARLESYVCDIAKRSEDKAEQLESYSVSLETELEQTRSQVANVLEDLSETEQEKDHLEQALTERHRELADTVRRLDDREQELKETKQRQAELIQKVETTEELIQRIRADAIRSRRLMYFGMLMASVFAGVLLFLLLR